MLTIRTAQATDLSAVLKIFAHARAFMKQTGNTQQWGDHWPPKEVLQDDIVQQRLYVVEADSIVHGAFAIVSGDEPTYAVIHDGAWLSNAPYVTIHRVASDGTVRGIFKEIVSFCAARHPHLRIDTHADNHVMQHLILKNGFQQCGIIDVEDGSTRIAYEKL